MAIDIQSEQLITFAELAARLPRRRQGRPVHVSTIHRWRHPGVRGVRLEAIRIGSAWHTTWEAFQRFVDALTAREPTAPTTTLSQQRAHDQAEQQLADSGW